MEALSVSSHISIVKQRYFMSVWISVQVIEKLVELKILWIRIRQQQRTGKKRNEETERKMKNMTLIEMTWNPKSWTPTNLQSNDKHITFGINKSAYCFDIYRTMKRKASEGQSKRIIEVTNRFQLMCYTQLGARAHTKIHISANTKWKRQ